PVQRTRPLRLSLRIAVRVRRYSRLTQSFGDRVRPLRRCFLRPPGLSRFRPGVRCPWDEGLSLVRRAHTAFRPVERPTDWLGTRAALPRPTASWSDGRA